jgi:hypothetical protein
MMQEWEASAHHLIYHFRCVIRGADPFSQSWEAGCENQRRGGLDDEAVAFIRKVKDLLNDGKGKYFLDPEPFCCFKFTVFMYCPVIHARKSGQ